jgi:hypothetical protein
MKIEMIAKVCDIKAIDGFVAIYLYINKLIKN